LERVATAKAITLRIPQLKDCKNHFDKKKEKGKGTMVFICEGQSAAGSIPSCRECLAHSHHVEYAPRAESGPIFNFYMGKNTPERKDYIMDSLVVPVEE
jgi:DNA gyrase/topoisomerase IV subunit B